ncbi:LCP family protein [Acetonema longum]|uniref:Cell envelope-related transcriptional attenuator n=1 Tax=Acetonema longum DSM 6540 TaxID=1009370 RepID=F7NE91_9FIRM|nr:LCP family protein [Acetonema longum]EGO65603.1 cell envelope-related transcriptional attenuator [Acetonema longum DSM 6540]
MESRKERYSSEKQTKPGKWWLLIASLVILLIGAIAYWAGAFTGFFDQTQPAAGTSGSADPAKKINVLALGIDKRQSQAGRSNVSCVITFDMAARNVSMLWIPQDSRVKIDGYGWQKIGQAYAHGGLDLAKKTVEDLLGIPLDYYLAVDMAGFSRVIDAVGGVDINVEKRMYYDAYDEGEVVNLQPGLQHLDGQSALQYIRFRQDEMGEQGRIERQQKFSKALLEKMASPAVIPHIPTIISETSSAVTTDLPAGEMLSLGKMAGDAYQRGLKTETVAGETIKIGPVDYWAPDIAALRRQVAGIQAIEADEAAAAALANEYEQSIPGKAEAAKP